jgi:thiol-disulfide isomerase/thioredoxin
VPTGALASPGDLWAVRAAIVPDGRPMLINHWATWCDGCVEELPALVAAHDAFGDRVAFVGVAWELFTGSGDLAESVGTVDRFARENRVRWPSIVFDGTPTELFEGLELVDTVIPQTFIVDERGAVRFHRVGAVAEAEIVDALRRS